MRIPTNAESTTISKISLTVERLGDGLRAEECLFVDDIELNCESARALGMTAVRFEHAEQAIAELQSALGD